MYPQYKFYLENLDGNLLLILTARKKKKTKTTVYQINYISYNTIDDVQKYIETPIAKLKSNLLGTLFTLYDFGIKPSHASHKTHAQTSSNESPLDNDNINNTTTNNTMNNNSQQDETAHVNPNMNESETYNASNNGSVNPSTESTHNNDIVVVDEDNSDKRKEFASVSYELNVLGIKGPRQMSVVIPGMDSKYNREDYVLKYGQDSLHSAWKKIESNLKYNSQQAKANTLSKLQTFKRSLFQLGPAYYTAKSTEDLNQVKIGPNMVSNNNSSSSKKLEIEENVVKLVNKQPSFHRELKSFALNFRGRVTQASVKNFQIVHEFNTDYIVMQFGKVDKDAYTCDYSYPMCALQAFGVALTSLDNKLGCD